jgi:hypothetical protein
MLRSEFTLPLELGPTCVEERIALGFDLRGQLEPFASVFGDDDLGL